MATATSAIVAVITAQTPAVIATAIPRIGSSNCQATNNTSIVIKAMSKGFLSEDCFFDFLEFGIIVS